jgi:hypothetical protein
MVMSASATGGIKEIAIKGAENRLFANLRMTKSPKKEALPTFDDNSSLAFASKRCTRFADRLDHVVECNVDHAHFLAERLHLCTEGALLF